MLLKGDRQLHQLVLVPQQQNHHQLSPAVHLQEPHIFDGEQNLEMLWFR